MEEYTLLSIIQAKQQLSAEYEAENKRHEDFLKKHKLKLNELDAIENILSHNLNIIKFEHGQEILELKFPTVRSGYSKQCIYKPIYIDLISTAKNDIANGALYLKKMYIGQKYYEGFDQRCDCEYGYGPSHGSVYQSIGIKSMWRSIELNAYDLECCLYVLNNLDIVLENLNNCK